MLTRSCLKLWLVPMVLAVWCRSVGYGDFPLASWIMLAVNDTAQQADAHLIQVRGTNLLIDAGHSISPMVALLKKHEVKRIHRIIISHPHKDHYGGLAQLLESNIAIEGVVMNLPLRRLCDREIPWGCDWADLQAIAWELRRKKIPLMSTVSGDTLFRSPEFALTTIFAHDGVSPPVGETDINDLSLILRLQAGRHRALFTGDLNRILGKFLAENQPDLQADVLKVPHHGTEGVAPDIFFERVAPQAALVPAPKALWHSERSQRIRLFFSRAAIPTLVSGEHGDIRVEFSRDRLHIFRDSSSNANR